MGLVRACYGKNAEPPEWWRWRHFDPSLNLPLIFGAFDGDTVVGIRPMVLFPFSLAGRALTGAVFSAVMVHPDYRRRGLFTGLVSAGTEEAWARGADFITTMPNDLSGQAFRRLGWFDPGLRTLMILPLDLPAIARARHLPGWLGSLAGTLARLVWQGRSRTFEHHEVKISEVDSISEAADDLADRICGQYEGLMLRRTSTWWNWRFRANPWNPYRRFEGRQPDGRLSGILVTATEDRHGLSVGYVADLLGVNADVRKALISRGVQYLVQDSVQVVATVLTDRTSLAEFRSQGFFRLPNSLSPKKFRTMYVPNPTNPSLVERLGHIENWYQTLGDWDGI